MCKSNSKNVFKNYEVDGKRDQPITDGSHATWPNYQTRELGSFKKSAETSADYIREYTVLKFQAV
jgi:hypothetical protein